LHGALVSLAVRICSYC